jgi:transposase-like protein
LKGLFAQPTRAEAHTHLDAFGAGYAMVYPEAVATLQRDIADCLTFYDFPREMWKHIRTNNALEGLFSTVRRPPTRWMPSGTKPVAS